MTAGPPARPTVPLVWRVLPRAGGARGGRLDGPLGRRPVACRGSRGPAAGRRTTRARALYRRRQWAGPAAHTAGESGRARPAGSGALGAGRPAVPACRACWPPDGLARPWASGGGVVEQVAEDAADRQRVHPDQQRPGSLDDDRMVGVGQPGGLVRLLRQGGRIDQRPAGQASAPRSRPAAGTLPSSRPSCSPCQWAIPTSSRCCRLDSAWRRCSRSTRRCSRSTCGASSRRWLPPAAPSSTPRWRPGGGLPRSAAGGRPTPGSRPLARTSPAGGRRAGAAGQSREAAGDPEGYLERWSRQSQLIRSPRSCTAASCGWRRNWVGRMRSSAPDGCLPGGWASWTSTPRPRNRAAGRRAATPTGV
jgi:hypothetical protein